MNYDEIKLKLKEKSVVFVGPVRNESKHLEQVFSNINRIGGLFKTFSCIFVESDSTDNSLELLNTFKAGKDNIHVISLGNLSDKYPSRLIRISIARNIGIEYAEQNGILDTHDYYIQMCMDVANIQEVPLENYLSCFKYDDSSWAGMTANQIQYYDIWTLRCKGWVDDDCWYKVQTRPAYMSRDEACDIYVGSKFIKIPEQYGLIEVDSAHGGFSIFKSEFVKGCRYKGYNEDTMFETSDIVSFCYGVKKNGGKIFINSEMINGYNW